MTRKKLITKGAVVDFPHAERKISTTAPFILRSNPRGVVNVMKTNDADPFHYLKQMTLTPFIGVLKKKMVGMGQRIWT